MFFYVLTTVSTFQIALLAELVDENSQGVFQNVCNQPWFYNSSVRQSEF